MNIFDNAREFVEFDNRKNRIYHAISTEILNKKLSVQLPKEKILDCTILDLGSCLGAAGHYAMTQGAKHYTGVEIQEYYYKNSKKFLKRYWDHSKFIIIKQEIEDFLDHCIKNNIKYDYVLACGIIYCYLDIVSILKKIAKVANRYIVIETVNYPSILEDKNLGEILINTQENMVRANDHKGFYQGVGARISISALDIIMSTCRCVRNEDLLYPEKITGKYDSYNSNDYTFENGKTSNLRYIARYEKTQLNSETLKDLIIDENSVKDLPWAFDSSVAERFQHEANTNIPSYNEVIDFCVTFAKKHLKRQDNIIDVGSALGFTMTKFLEAGFTNVMGVDNSKDMNDKNPHNTILSDTLPKQKYKLILMNWTLHFVLDKDQYLRDIYECLDDNGYLILTDKCIQSNIVKDLYYDFKRSKGVSEEYIIQKEKSLKNVMHLKPVTWYLQTLTDLNFTVDIVSGNLGFTTFLCKK